jgi:hypothetical protein
LELDARTANLVRSREDLFSELQRRAILVFCLDRYVAYRWNCARQYETLQMKMKKALRSKGRFAKPPVYGSH